MALFSSRSIPPFAPDTASVDGVVSREVLGQQLSALYARVQNSSHLFGSSLGPIMVDERSCDVPHFVYFGPRSSDESARFAFISGLDAADLRGSLSLLRFIDHLREFPVLGDGLSMSFFPVVDALGTFKNVQGRELGKKSWHTDAAPELGLLAREIRARRYHGFVRIESAPAGVEEIVVSTRRVGRRTADRVSASIITPEETELLAARFEPESVEETFADGPLSVEGNMPFAPFEVTLALPRSLTESAHRVAVNTILRRLFRRYRGLQAYGQHL
jgi:hypothetical protein